MNRLWLIIGIIAFILILVLVSGNLSSSISQNSDNMAYLSYYGLIALACASSILGSGVRLSHILRNGLIWIAIILILMIGYNARYELQDTLHRVTAGLIPGSPITQYNENGLTVTLERMQNGHFETQAEVNGATLHFMIDTGASSIVLSYNDAARAGIDVSHLHFTIPVSTANGETTAAYASVERIKVGGIERRNVSVMVANRGNLDSNLLGMNFMNMLKGYSVRGDRMTLVD